jgi:hypothetical protein
VTIKLEQDEMEGVDEDEWGEDDDGDDLRGIGVGRGGW